MGSTYRMADWDYPVPPTPELTERDMLLASPPAQGHPAGQASPVIVLGGAGSLMRALAAQMKGPGAAGPLPTLMGLIQAVTSWSPAPLPGPRSWGTDAGPGPPLRLGSMATGVRGPPLCSAGTSYSSCRTPWIRMPPPAPPCHPTARGLQPAVQGGILCSWAKSGPGHSGFAVRVPPCSGLCPSDLVYLLSP